MTSSQTRRYQVHTTRAYGATRGMIVSLDPNLPSVQRNTRLGVIKPIPAQKKKEEEE